MPGKASTLLIWLGKSLRPVPTTAAPASRASCGMISGSGLAMVNKMGSGAIERTISGVTVPGADTPMNTSAPRMTCSSVPDTFSRLEMAAISRLLSFRPSRPS